METVSDREPGRADVLAFLARPRRDGRRRSPAGQNQELAALRSLSAYAIENRVWRRNPTKGIPFAREAPHDPVVLGAEELRRLFRAARAKPPAGEGAQVLAILGLLSQTGLRVHELVGLDLGQVDLLTATLLSVRGKGDTLHDLPLNIPALSLLKGWLAERTARVASEEQALFVSRRGTRLSARTVQCWVVGLRSAMGTAKRITPHTLRHTAATLALTMGADLSTVAELLRHSDLNTTRRYLHLVDTRRREAVARLAITVPEEIFGERGPASAPTPPVLIPVNPSVPEPPEDPVISRPISLDGQYDLGASFSPSTTPSQVSENRENHVHRERGTSLGDLAMKGILSVSQYSSGRGMGSMCKRIFLLVLSLWMTRCASSPGLLESTDAAVDTQNETTVDVAFPRDTDPTFDASFDLMESAVQDSTVADVPNADVGCAAGSVRCGDTCIDPTTSLANCGACGVDCRSLPGVSTDRVTCARGACVLDGACLAGRGDCDNNILNGCEADLTTPMNCGRCGATCSGMTPICTMVPGDAGATRVCGSGCTSMAPTRCGMACVDTASDLGNCGGCGMACPAPANGAATCATGSCGRLCNPGFHLCGSLCLSNLSVDSCGSSCMACAPPPPNGMSTCDGSACGFICVSGYHRCGDRCASNTSPATCGMACVACDTPMNGTATCDGTACGTSCSIGFHLCAGSCVPSTVTTSCGTSCMPCPTPANSRSTCDGTACGFTCNAGFHRCGTGCVSDTSILSCGTSCTACPTPSNATATCDGLVCGSTCNTGFHRCADTCVSDTSAASCGTSCTACPTRANASAACSAGACSVSCNAGFADCNGNATDGCERRVDFDRSNCGACGRVCSFASPLVTPVCGSAQCVPVYVYGNTARTLYAINPTSFAATPIADFRLSSVVTYSDMADIAVSSTNDLYGITFDSLYYIDPSTAYATFIGWFGGRIMNAFAVVPGVPGLVADRFFVMSGEGSAAGNVYEVNTRTAALTLLGPLGGGMVAAGDMAWVPGVGLVGAVVQAGINYLALIDTRTGHATILAGNAGTAGLAYWNNTLYGFTLTDQSIVSLDTSLGVGPTVAYSHLSWYGAASTAVFTP